VSIVDTPASLDALAPQLAGRLTRPADANYERVRLLQNSRFDNIRPAAVVTIANDDDVARTINFARVHAMPFAVRSGGHSYAGWSSGSGLVIDTRGMAGVGTVDANGLVTIGAGTQLIDVYSALAAQNVAVPGGSCPTIGFAGLALGGGHGLTSRAFGMTCDTVRSIEIVTADGVVRHCDATNEPDLYWACRGGGGSFGVVTKFTVATHPLPKQSTTFVMRYSWAHAHDALARWMGLVGSLPRQTMTIARLEHARTNAFVVAGLHLGSAGETRRLLAEMLPSAQTSSVVARPFIEAQMLEAGCLHASLAACHSSAITPGGSLNRQTPLAASSHYFSDALSNDAIDAAMARVAQPASGASASIIQFDSYGGAIADIPADATAFVHRNAHCSAQYLSSFTSGNGAGSRAWIRTTHDAMAPFSNGESYQNYIDPELPDWPKAYYGSNFERLKRIKLAYDPDNLFRFPQSIPVAE
jgi:FAD/FMN-containing dehydrogenase